MEDQNVAIAFKGKRSLEDDPLTFAAIKAWNMMGGEINWQALEHVNAVVGVDDPELLLTALMTIRDHLRAQNA